MERVAAEVAVSKSIEVQIGDKKKKDKTSDFFSKHKI